MLIRHLISSSSNLPKNEEPSLEEEQYERGSALEHIVWEFGGRGGVSVQTT